MTKTKIISAMLSAVLLSGSSVAMPADMTQNTTTTPAVYESEAPAQNDLAIETSANNEANVEFVADSLPTIETSLTESAPTESMQAASVPKVSSSTCCYYVKPGDQQIKESGLVINWTDFQYVSEAYEGEWTTLSGCLNGDEWSFSYTDDGRVEGSLDLPLTYDFSGCALGLPIAMSYGPTTLEGWTFMTAGKVSYCHAPGTCYVSGDGWDAIILDSRRYAEWKDAANFRDAEKYKLIVHNSGSWVIVTGNVPGVELESSEPEDVDIDALAEKIKKMAPMPGVSNPKWGTINWSENIREEIADDGVFYWLEAELNGRQFSIEIDDESPLGFTEKHQWSAAIVPADFVTHENVSMLHYEHYTISVVNNDVCLVNTATDQVRNVSIDGDARMSGSTTLLTLTDGKHAKCVTMRPELVAFIYAISG